MTTLSVIVPMRDVAPYVGDLLLSLAHNDREDFEFLAVDDGSVDRTPQILAEHAERMPRLTIVRNDKPLGLSGARNRGLAASSGRLITYLDGDDWLAPGYLAQAVEAIDAIGCDYIKTDHIQVYGKRREVHRAPQGRRGVKLNPRDGILPAHVKTMADYPNAWSGIYRRSLADDGLLTFEESLLTCEDRPWTWKLMLHASSYAVVSLFGVFYRREVAGSLTKIGDERQLHFFDAFDKVLAELDSDRERDRYAAKAVQTYIAMMAHHLTERDRLTPSAQLKLRQRARATLRSLPPDVIDQIRPRLTKERQELFASTVGIVV